MNYVLSRFSGRAAVLFMLAAVVPSFAFADLTEESKLTSLPANAGALVGNGAAISDDGAVAVVGAPGDEAVYVFTRSGTTWTKVATLTASDTVAGDHFGASVSISGVASGANVAVGAPDRNSGAGAVYVFSGSDVNWTQKTTPPLTSALTVASAGHLGTSVSIQGLRIAAGAPNTTAGRGANAGLAFVFDFDSINNVFTSTSFRANGGQARVGALFGTSVSLSGSTVLVGAPHYSTGHKSSGAVFVFVNNGGTYTQQANVRPGNITNNFAGTSVSLFNDTAAFGAPGNANNKGAVYVYTRTGTLWTLTSTITDPGNTANDVFGSSVAQLGTFLVAGAPGTNSNAGATYEFGKSGSSYSLINQLVPSDNPAGATFGFSASVNSGRALVGAPTDGAAGSAYVFKFLVPSITQVVSTSVGPSPPNSALTGVPYTVNVNVNHDIGGTGTPTGTVHVSDGVSGACDATLDGSGNGSCQVTSNFFGVVTLKATYDGDLTFSPSQDQIGLELMVTGDHLVFNPVPPADVKEDDRFVGTVELRNGADQIINSTANVTITVTDTCGNPNVFDPVAMVAGVATFNGNGPRVESNGQALPTPINISADAGAAGAQTQSSFNLVANPDLIFQDNLEGSCLN